MYGYDINYTKLFCEFRIERNNYAFYYIYYPYLVSTVLYLYIFI